MRANVSIHQEVGVVAPGSSRLSGANLRRLLEATINITPRLVVDLGAVSEIPADGLATLFFASRRARSAGGDLKVAGACSSVSAKLAAARAHWTFEIYRETDTAVESFSRQCA